MSDDDDDKEDIYVVQTVPPPAGESDPYNAVTKVGAIDPAIQEMVAHAMRAAEEAAEAKAEQKKKAEINPDLKPDAASRPATDGALTPRNLRAAPLSVPGPRSTAGTYSSLADLAANVEHARADTEDARPAPPAPAPPGLTPAEIVAAIIATPIEPLVGADVPASVPDPPPPSVAPKPVTPILPLGSIPMEKAPLPETASRDRSVSVRGLLLTTVLVVLVLVAYGAYTGRLSALFHLFG